MTTSPRDQRRVSETDWLRTVEQTGWLERLRAAGIEAHLIRMPQDWDHFTHLTATDPEQLTLTTTTTRGAK